MNTNDSSDRLIMLARSGKRLTPTVLVVLLALLVAAVSAIVLGGLGSLLVNAVFGSREVRNTSATISGLGEFIKLLAGFGPVVLFVWLWTRFFEKRPFWTIGLERDGWLVKTLRGALLGFLMMSVWVAVAYALGGVQFEAGAPYQAGVAALGGVLFALLARIVQGPAEEVLFRGWVMSVLGARYRPWIGVVVSSLLFGSLHALNAGRNMIAIVNIALFGVFLALYALYEGSMWGVIGWHALYNWTQFNFYGLDVTPKDTAGGAVINMAYTSANPFVTTGFVAEDGLLSTMLLAVGVTVLAALMLRRGATATSRDASLRSA